jgi:hypothetical protein
MTHDFKLARRVARLRTPLLALLALSFAACDSADDLTSTTREEAPPAVEPAADADQLLEDSLAVEDSLAMASGDPTGGIAIDEPYDDLEEMEEQVDNEILGADPAAAAAGAEGLSFANRFRGGIPFGTFHLPKSSYGRTYTGSLANISPGALISYLETARRTGTKVMLSLSGSDRTYKRRGTFSLTMWKARVNRYRGLNLTPYIKDGTIIAHYLMDEPHNKRRFGGKVVTRATIDEMAKYSKQLWPSMPTAIRSWPAYLRGYRYRYLDAAWAQYSANYGASSQRLPINAFIANNVRDARHAGLGLVVGLNLLAGGSRRGLRGFYPGQRAPTAGELRSWGAVLLNNSHACAFIAWKYHPKYLSRSDIRSAMSYLAGKARSRGGKSCRAGGGGGGGGDRDDDDD